jgi:hypothetical protein
MERVKRALTWIHLHVTPERNTSNARDAERDARAPVPEVRTIRSLAVMSIFDKYFKNEFKDVKVLWSLLFAWRPT